MLEATAPDDVPVLRQYETGLQRAVAWVANRLRPLEQHHEALHAAQSAAEVSAAPAFPPLPLTVVTGMKPAMAWATNAEALVRRAQHQRASVALSPLGKQIEAARSGHFPQFTEPDLVLAAIRELMSGSADA
jgi:pimeloyl-ACP methyl ester carboxylesterase